MLVLFGLTFAGLVAPLSISKEEYWLSDLFSQHLYLPHCPIQILGRSCFSGGTDLGLACREDLLGSLLSPGQSQHDYFFPHNTQYWVFTSLPPPTLISPKQYHSCISWTRMFTKKSCLPFLEAMLVCSHLILSNTENGRGLITSCMNSAPWLTPWRTSEIARSRNWGHTLRVAI